MENLLMSFPNTLDSATLLKCLIAIFTSRFCHPFCWQNINIGFPSILLLDQYLLTRV